MANHFIEDVEEKTLYGTVIGSLLRNIILNILKDKKEITLINLREEVAKTGYKTREGKEFDYSGIIFHLKELDRVGLIKYSTVPIKKAKLLKYPKIYIEEVNR